MSPKTSKIDSIPDHPYIIGKNYLIRTVTMFQLGKIEAVYDKELVLEAGTCSWIADTGKWNNALKHGIDALSEVEPFIDMCIVGRGAIIDVVPWNHDLPTKQKS